MIKYFLVLSSFLILVNGFTYDLNDFYRYDAKLGQKTDSVYQSLSMEERVGQMIVVAAGRLGQSETVINELITKNKIGGIILLNGTMQGFTEMKAAYQKLNKGLPLLFSADAEPSLIAYKIKGSTPVKKANEMLSRKEVLTYTEIICKDLNKIGIQYNYAPVVDMSPNKVVSSRSFGDNADTAQAWAKVFIEATQKNGIAATAKHFPGHGYVVGDTHKQLVYINGEMKEVKNYVPLINAGVISIMVGHIAVKNNEEFGTNDLPATCSNVIVTKLLKEKLQFKGLVITDAMNMGGVAKVPNCELKAAQAGCDIILMPVNASKAINDIVLAVSQDKIFEEQIAASVKKIIRLKICLGLIP